jgi:pilus assembly protein CpaD
MSSNEARAMTKPSFLIALLPLLAGCADLAKEDPRLGHPIDVELRTLHAELAPESADGFSAGQQEQLRQIAGEAQRRAAGAATVASGDPAWAHRVAEQLRRDGAGQVVEAAGANPGATIDMPVWQAKPPQCGDFGEFGMNPDYDNAPNLNWGCAVRHNIAVMTQNPADLMRARPASGRDGNRSTDVLDKYGRGLATSSSPEPQAAAANPGSTGGH